MAVIAPITQVVVSVDSQGKIILKDKLSLERPEQADFRDADTKFFDSFAYNRELSLYKDTKEALRDFVYIGTQNFKVGSCMKKDLFEFQGDLCKMKGE
jgi:hypothetical protein